MKAIFFAIALCSLCFNMTARAGNVPVDPAPVQKQYPAGEIKIHSLEDNRGDFIPGLRVELAMPPIWANSYRYMEDPVVTQAVDNLGVNLMKDKSGDSDKSYDFHAFKEKARLDLFNPSRTATTVSIKGYIPVLMTDNDPQSVMLLDNITAFYGRAFALDKEGTQITVFDKTSATAQKPQTDKTVEQLRKKQQEHSGQLGEKEKEIANAFLEMFVGISQSTVESMGPNDLMYVINDPKGKIGLVLAYGPDMRPIKSSGRFSMGSGTDKTIVINNNQPVPAGSKIYVFLATDKSVVKIPFDFQNVKLP